MTTVKYKQNPYSLLLLLLIPHDKLHLAHKPDHPIGLIMDQLTLDLVIRDEAASRDLLEVSNRCQTVICCRCRPDQKAAMVRLVKRHTPYAHTLAVGDGAEATALYVQHQDRIAAVITDLKMPYLDGLGVIRAIRRLGGTMPGVLMTTEQEEPPANLKELQAALLPKPFTTTDLLAAVANAVKSVRT